MIEVPEQVEQCMLTVLQKGDRIITKAHKKAKLLVGLTKVGKSCTSNWISNIPMIGQGNDVETHYETQIVGDDSRAAEEGRQLASQTLIPNIEELTENDEKISIIDMAGYEDNRDYIGVMGVSYFIKSVFQHIDEVQFIIVITEEILKEKSSAKFCKTMQCFFNMFKNIDFLNPNEMMVKTQLYDSMSILITHSENPAKHLAHLKNIKDRLKVSKISIAKKAEIIDFLEYITSKNRIDEFPIAQLNQQSPHCNILAQFADLGWKYFNIRQVERQKEKEIINIPYKEDFQKLDEENQEKFNKQITGKIDNFSRCSIMLTIIFNKFKQNWLKMVQDKQYENNPNFYSNILNFDSFFQAALNFLEKNDKYDTTNMKFFNPKQVPYPTFFKSFNALLFIFDSIKQIEQLQLENEYTDFFITMSKFSSIWGLLIDNLFVICKSSIQEHILHRLKFVLLRGVYEFIQFQKIDKYKFGPAKNNCIDRCISCFDKDTKQLFLAKIIESIDFQLMSKLFKTVEDCDQYEKLFKIYLKDFKYAVVEESRIQQQFFIAQQQINFSQVKAQLFISRVEGLQAMKQHIIFMRSLIKQCDLTERMSYYRHSEMEQKLNGLYISKLICSSVIINILRETKTDKMFNARNLALRLAIYVGKIHEACLIYKQIILETKAPREKSEILQNYANYCIGWGRYEEAKIALQQKLSISQYSYKEMLSTKKRLISLANDFYVNQENYKKKLQDLDRLPSDDPNLNNILKEIEIELEIEMSRNESTNRSVDSKDNLNNSLRGSTQDLIGVAAFN